MSLKATDKPEFCPKWWRDEKPDDVKGKELSAALENVSKVFEQWEKQQAAAVYDSVTSALKELEKAVDRTISKECDKKKHKETISVLDKFFKAIKEEAKRLEEEKAQSEKDNKGAKGGDDEEAEDQDEKKVFTKEYRYKKIKKVKQGETFNFGLGLNLDNPCDSDLLLSVMFKPERLYKMLKSHKDASGKLAYTDRCICCGTVFRDPANSKILVCKLGDGEKEPPRFFKATRLMLRGDKKLLFKKTRLICGSSVLDDPEPLSAADGDDAESGDAPQATADLTQRIRSATKAAGIWTKTNDSVSEQIEKLRAELGGFDDVDVEAIRKRLASFADRFPQIDFTPLVGAADEAAFTGSLEKVRTSVTNWRKLLASDPVLLSIDDNPFAELHVLSTYGSALDEIVSELKL